MPNHLLAAKVERVEERIRLAQGMSTQGMSRLSAEECRVAATRTCRWRMMSGRRWRSRVSVDRRDVRLLRAPWKNKVLSVELMSKIGDS